MRLCFDGWLVRSRWAGFWTALGILPAAFAVLPAVSAASTTIGRTSSSAFPCNPLNPPLADVRWQHSTGPGSPSYAVAAGGGVITSWRTNPGNNAGTSTRLEVVRESNNTIAGESARQSNIHANKATTFPTRIPVESGDRIGLELGPSGSVPCSYTGGASDVAGNTSDPGPGNPFSGLSMYGGYLTNVSAVVERDADRDGYGDATQDACPAARTRHREPCALQLGQGQAEQEEGHREAARQCSRRRPAFPRGEGGQEATAWPRSRGPYQQDGHRARHR